MRAHGRSHTTQKHTHTHIALQLVRSMREGRVRACALCSTHLFDITRLRTRLFFVVVVVVCLYSNRAAAAAAATADVRTNTHICVMRVCVCIP